MKAAGNHASQKAVGHTGVMNGSLHWGKMKAIVMVSRNHNNVDEKRSCSSLPAAGSFWFGHARD